MTAPDAWRGACGGGRRDGHRLAHERAQRGGTERNDDVRTHGGDFRFEPIVAGGDLALRRRLVNAPLAAQLEAEMLDGVGDVRVALAHARFRHQLPQQPPRRADERSTFLILDVARLLADQHQRRMPRALAGHGLGRARAEVAAPAAVEVRLAGAGRHRRDAVGVARASDQVVRATVAPLHQGHAQAPGPSMTRDRERRERLRLTSMPIVVIGPRRERAVLCVRAARVGRVRRRVAGLADAGAIAGACTVRPCKPALRGVRQ